MSVKNRHTQILWFAASLFLILLPIARILYILHRDGLYLVDFGAYCEVSLLLFKGQNPFPSHPGYLINVGGINNPFVFPGQMLLFAPLGYLWSQALQFAWLVLNVFLVFFLTGLVLVKACGYKWRDLLMPGRRQFYFALCCASFLSSSNAMNTMRLGQIPIVLAFLLLGMFWAPASRGLRTILFAVIAAVKYSVLTVFAPLLFFKGSWKLCIAAFALFIFLTISPVFCGNNLREVYTSYFDDYNVLFVPGGANHFSANGVTMCQLELFKLPILNHIMKAIAVCLVLWLFWRERKSKAFPDTLLLLALSLTMLLSYHQFHDLSLIFPFLFIRLFAFARAKQWVLFGITACFPLFLDIPGRVLMKFFSFVGGIPGLGSVIYLPDMMGVPHIFPFMVFYTIALTLWSLYLYLHVDDPYRFEIPESSCAAKDDGMDKNPGDERV